MPYITEELWQKTAGEQGRDTMLVTAAWPTYDGLGDEARRPKWSGSSA
jgi:valyl-tRNA synthetase